MTSVCPSVMLVDCDHTVQRKVEIGHNRIGWCLLSASRSQPGSYKYRPNPVIRNSAEEDQRGMEKCRSLQFAVISAACVQQIECRAISACAELFHSRPGPWLPTPCWQVRSLICGWLARRLGMSRPGSDDQQHVPGVAETTDVDGVNRHLILGYILQFHVNRYHICRL